MNDLEWLQGQMAAMNRRLTRLEGLLAARRMESADSGAARSLAEQLGLDGGVLERGAWSAAAVGKRRDLARALSKQNWGVTRIARVLGCCDRTAARYLNGTANASSPLRAETGVRQEAG